MKNLFLLFNFILLLGSATYGQNCQALSQNVVVRAFSLGMTEAQVKKRYPKIEFYKDSGVVGVTKWSGERPTSFDDVFTETEREDLARVELTFFDKKLSRIKIIYTGFIKWDSLAEFTDVSAKVLKLPPAADWHKTDDEESIKIECKDFSVVSKLELPRSQYELQEPSLLFTLNSLESDLKNKQKALEDSQKREFKP